MIMIISYLRGGFTLLFKFYIDLMLCGCVLNKIKDIVPSLHEKLTAVHFFNFTLSCLHTLPKKKHIQKLITVETHLQLVLGGGGGSTPLYSLYGDVPLKRVWFLASLS